MTARVQCRYASLAELPLAAVDAPLRWLRAQERAELAGLRMQSRRETYLAGRIVAKQLLIESIGHSGIEPADLRIVSRSAETNLGVRPSVEWNDQPLDVSLSIAHTERGVLAAVCGEAGVLVGVDLVLAGSESSAGLDWCLTSSERQALAIRPIGKAAVRLWAIKEALFKAQGAGEGFAPWRIDAVRPLSLSHGQRVQCWRVDGHVAALVIRENEAPTPTRRADEGDCLTALACAAS